MIISTSGGKSNTASSLPIMGDEKFIFDNIYVTNIDSTTYPTRKLSIAQPTGIDTSFVGSGIFNGKKIDLSWDIYSPFSQSIVYESGHINKLYQFDGIDIKIYETGFSTTPYSGLIGELNGPTGSVTGFTSGLGVTGYSTGNIDLYGATGDYLTGHTVKVAVELIGLREGQRVSPYEDIINAEYATFSFGATNKVTGLSGMRSGDLLNQKGSTLELVSGNTYVFNMSGVTSGYDLYLSTGNIFGYETGSFGGEYTRDISGSRATYGGATGRLTWALTGKMPHGISGEALTSLNAFSSKNANYWENFSATTVNILEPFREVAITGQTTGNLGTLTGITGVVTGVTYLNGVTGYVSGLIYPRESRLIYQNSDYRGMNLSFYTTTRENVVEMGIRDKEGTRKEGKIFLVNSPPDLINLKSSVKGGKLEIKYSSADSDFIGTQIFLSNSLVSGGLFEGSTSYSNTDLDYYVGTTTGFVHKMKASTPYYARIIPMDLFSEGVETGIYKTNVEGEDLISIPHTELYGQVFSPEIKNLIFEPAEGYQFNFGWETNLENYDFEYIKIKKPRRVERLPQYGPFSGELTKSDGTYSVSGKQLSMEVQLPVDETAAPDTGYYFSGTSGAQGFAPPYGDTADGLIANQQISGENYSFINSGINRNLKLYRNNTYFFDFGNNLATENHFYFSLKPIWEAGTYANEYTEGVSGSRATTGVLKIEVTGLENYDQLYFYSAESGFAGRFNIEDPYLYKYTAEIESVITGYQEKILEPEIDKEIVTGLQYAVDYSYSGADYNTTGIEITKLLAPYNGDTTSSLFSINNLGNSGIREVGFTVKLLADETLVASQSISGRIPALAFDSYTLVIDYETPATGLPLLGGGYTQNYTGFEGTILFQTNDGTSGSYQSGINIYTGVTADIEIKNTNLIDPSYIIENDPEGGFVSFLHLTGTGSIDPVAMNYRITPVDRIGEGAPTLAFSVASITEFETVSEIFFIENLDSLYLSHSNSARINFPQTVAPEEGQEIKLQYQLYYTGSYDKEYVDYLFTMVSGVNMSGFNIDFSYYIPDTGYALYIHAEAKDITI